METPTRSEQPSQRQREQVAGGRALQCGGGCVIVNLCALIIGADFAVLPSAYREIGQDLDATPTQLGLITLAVGVTSNVASLIPALFAGKISRPGLVSGGCFLWAATAALMGLSHSYRQLLYFRAINVRSASDTRPPATCCPHLGGAGPDEVAWDRASAWGS